MLKCLKSWKAKALATVAAFGVGGSAFAGGGGGGPLEMPAVEFPIEPSSLGEAIAIAGGSMLLILFTVGIGFTLVRSLRHGLTNAVRG